MAKLTQIVSFKHVFGTFKIMLSNFSFTLYPPSSVICGQPPSRRVHCTLYTRNLEGWDHWKDSLHCCPFLHHTKSGAHTCMLDKFFQISQQLFLTPKFINFHLREKVPQNGNLCSCQVHVVLCLEVVFAYILQVRMPPFPNIDS